MFVYIPYVCVLCMFIYKYTHIHVYVLRKKNIYIYIKYCNLYIHFIQVCVYIYIYIHIFFKIYTCVCISKSVVRLRRCKWALFCVCGHPCRDQAQVLQEDREKLLLMEPMQPCFTQDQMKELTEVHPWIHQHTVSQEINAQVCNFSFVSISNICNV